MLPCLECLNQFMRRLEPVYPGLWAFVWAQGKMRGGSSASAVPPPKCKSFSTREPSAPAISRRLFGDEAAQNCAAKASKPVYRCVAFGGPAVTTALAVAELESSQFTSFDYKLQRLVGAGVAWPWGGQPARVPASGAGLLLETGMHPG